MNTALISLILRKGKDPTLCASWRPLSLIKSDIKLLSEVLTLQLETYLPKLIHPDQNGFVRKHLISDHLHCLLHVVSSSTLQFIST